jgi:hypothetical protein
MPWQVAPDNLGYSYDARGRIATAHSAANQPQTIGRPKNKVVSLIAPVRVENLSVAVIRHDSVGILHCLRVALILQLIVFRARIGFILRSSFF